MAYDNRLAERIRSVLVAQPGVVERAMFGGLAFMVDGNMACGVIGDDLMVRVGPQAFDEAMSRPHVRVMDFTHRPSRGMVYVAPAGVSDDADLAAWVGRGVKFARTLPSK
jgi:TfoX/Sxy family transcriptional regulator of competence genes